MKRKGLNIDLKQRDNWVAIIGTRHPTEAERNASYELGMRCARQGKVVVSGLAIGIDGKAHQGAIDAGGKTIAIVSTPIFQDIYPEPNIDLSNRILENGCILFPFETRDSKKIKDQFNNRLRERDLLVAYVCPTIVIVKDSATIITGGSRWATNYGYRYNKKILRYDSQKIFHENPLVNKKEEPKWIMELNIEEVSKQYFE
jgi:predicted Rossmann fold nucleotide-binding protein DprA/Smf involved in DNA uptake